MRITMHVARGKGLVAALGLALSIFSLAAPAAARPLGEPVSHISSAMDEAVATGSVSSIPDRVGAQELGVPESGYMGDRVELFANAQQPVFPIAVSANLRQPDAFNMLQMVNAERASVGVPALQWDRDLEEAAMQRAAEIALYFSHTRPDGSDCFTAFPANNHAVGENIAAGLRTTQATFEGWKNSPGHYGNMVSGNFNKIGIACVYVPGTYFQYYWVQCFGGGDSTGNQASMETGSASFAVAVPDSLITDISWTNKVFTPGVDSLRGLPSVRVSFDGWIGQDDFSSRVYGQVDYDYSFFDWAIDNDKIAAFLDDGSNWYVLGVAPGSTKARATFAFTPKLNMVFDVRVTKEGAFTDVFSSTDHRAHILWLSGTGVTAGYPDGSFKPMTGVARCDMAAFLRRLARSMDISDAATWQPSEADYARFKDVSRGTPHAADVLWLAHAGISTGFDDNTFRPYDIVKRCDMAAFLRRFAKLGGLADAASWKPASADFNRFVDVTELTPHANDVLWLAHSSVSTGFPDHTFRAYGNVVRCDMAAFLHRLASLKA